MLLLNMALYPLKFGVFLLSSWWVCQQSLSKNVRWKDACLHLCLQKKCKVRLHRLEGGHDDFFRDTMVRDCIQLLVSTCE